MSRRSLFVAAMAALLVLSFALHLCAGVNAPAFTDIWQALSRFEADNYDQSVVLFQRLPRAAIALYAGAVTAISGCVLQGLIRNPLASPSTLGVNAGATLGVIVCAFLLGLGTQAQGFAALAGGVVGFLACLAVARLAGRRNDPRGLSLILSGALVSMLLVATVNAITLSDPARRSDFLSWISGNINHVYIDRLYNFWWIGATMAVVLAALAKSLTVIQLGQEKAESVGVSVALVSRTALAAAILGSASAVAVCGPIGFVGLVVPHLVRPLAGPNFTRALPACAATGASLCLLADFIAREAFRPFSLNTGLVMDVLGGLAFIVIVKRFYLAPSNREKS
jgi:iron complex transport system permease protein